MPIYDREGKREQLLSGFLQEIKRKGRDLLPFNELYKICKANLTPEPLFLKRRGILLFFCGKEIFISFSYFFSQNSGDEE